MEDFVPINPVVFVMICLGWMAIAFFFLAGRKVYFEPFKEPKDSE